MLCQNLLRMDIGMEYFWNGLVDSRPATKGGPGGRKPPPGSNLASLKFSELLFILLYSVYYCSPNARLPAQNIFAPPWYVF